MKPTNTTGNEIALKDYVISGAAVATLFLMASYGLGIWTGFLDRPFRKASQIASHTSGQLAKKTVADFGEKYSYLQKYDY